MNAYQRFLAEIARSHDGDIEITGMLRYACGTLVLFKREYRSASFGDQLEHRVAFFRVENNVAHKVWDHIA
jgi:hypothetical protein